MVVDDALRIAGRARGVVERDRVPFVVGHRPGEIRIAAGDEVFVVERADPLALRVGRVGRIVGIVIVDHQRLRLRQRQRLLDDAGEFAVDDQHLRSRHGRAGRRSIAASSRVLSECSTAFDHRHAEMRFQHGGVLASITETVSPLPMPRLRQRRGKLQRASPEIAIGDAPAAMDDRDVVGIGLGGALQKGERRQRLVVGGVLVEIDLVRICHDVPLGFQGSKHSALTSYVASRSATPS